MTGRPQERKPMEDESPLRLRAVVRGRVQGVGFREFTRRHAAALGLCGWVRNRPDGSVELEAEGPRSALDELLRQVRTGPRLSHVEAVDAAWQWATGEDGWFRVL
jgi:acylphosphatase